MVNQAAKNMRLAKPKTLPYQISRHGLKTRSGWKKNPSVATLK